MIRHLHGPDILSQRTRMALLLITSVILAYSLTTFEVERCETDNLPILLIAFRIAVPPSARFVKGDL